MKEYLAKSNPQETIQEHTDNLITNYQLIKKLYPEINVDWYLLELVCLLHDLGKRLRQELCVNGKNHSVG